MDGVSRCERTDAGHIARPQRRLLASRNAVGDGARRECQRGNKDPAAANESGYSGVELRVALNLARQSRTVDQGKTVTDPIFPRMVSNAFTFLTLATSDFVNRPDQAAIRVYTAIELILKARLLHHDWRLVPTKPVSRQLFEDGDFNSVTFSRACERLDDDVNDPVPPGLKARFDALRIRRNVVVHFAPPENTELLAHRANEKETRQICREAWSGLHELMRSAWKPVFKPWEAELEKIEVIMERLHRVAAS